MKTRMEKLMIITVILFFSPASSIHGFPDYPAHRTWAPHLRDIAFLDSLNIIVVGDFGTIRKSTDAGLTWNEQNSGTSLDLMSVKFITPLEGLVVGDSAIILRTTNGGIIWSPVYGHVDEKFFDICYLNSDTIISGGTDRAVYSKPLLSRSTNGGLSWNSVPLTVPASISDIEQASENAIFIVGHQELLRSTDAGIVWSDTPMTPLTVLGVSFCNPDRGLIGARRSSDVQDIVLRTTDGGNTWTQHILDTLGAHPIVTDIAFPDSNNAFIVTMNGGIFHSSDGGVEWVLQSEPLSLPSGDMGVACWSSAIAIVVGPDGLILKTTNSGDSWSLVTSVNDDGENSVPIRHHLSDCYPNPFNNSTTIRYELPIETRVTLIIHDILGNTIFTLLDEVQPSGRYSIPWEAGGRPSGIYLLEFRAGVYQDVKKLMLLK